MLFHTSCSKPFILVCNILTVSLADIVYTWKISNKLLINAHMQGWNYSSNKSKQSEILRSSTHTTALAIIFGCIVRAKASIPKNPFG